MIGRPTVPVHVSHYLYHRPRRQSMAMSSPSHVVYAQVILHPQQGRRRRRQLHSSTEEEEEEETDLRYHRHHPHQDLTPP